jgi:hypothetical protein
VRPPENPGPPELHEPVDGGASRLQMELMGGGHHPRCLHYEWGACTCALYEGETTGEEEAPVPRAEDWVAGEAPGDWLVVEHLGGVPWHDAPGPRLPRLHRLLYLHRARTRAVHADGTTLERCACGATRAGRLLSPGRWLS